MQRSPSPVKAVIFGGRRTARWQAGAPSAQPEREVTTRLGLAFRPGSRLGGILDHRSLAVAPLPRRRHPHIRREPSCLVPALGRGNGDRTGDGGAGPAADLQGPRLR